MITWELKNGDLAIGSNGFSEVSGTSKVQQDLTLASLEPYGCDRFHPQWGSLLSNYIGTEISPVAETLIRSEVSRLIQNYILVQQDQILTEVSQGTPGQYTSDEVVGSLESISIEQSQDRLNVSVVVKTISGASVELSNSVSA